MTRVSWYRYVGPAEVLGLAAVADAVAVNARVQLAAWLAACGRDELDEPFTFVVAFDGGLRFAPRRSEHVVLAGYRAVLATGELAFARGNGEWRVVEVTTSRRATALTRTVGRRWVRRSTVPGSVIPAASPRSSPSGSARSASSATSFETTTSLARCATPTLPTSWNFAAG